MPDEIELPAQHKSVAVQRIECLEEQIRDYRGGHIRKIGCPWCGTRNKAGEVCCDLFAQGLNVALDHLKMTDEKEFMDAVMDRVN